MPRVPVLDETALTAEQRRVYAVIASGPRGGVRGPLRVWLHSPELADKAQALGAFCRYATSLPARLSELAIIATGAHWRAGYEWTAHAPAAIEAGVDPATVECIRLGAAPQLEKADEAAVYAFARELLQTRKVSEATFARTVELLGHAAVVELVGIIGYYCLVCLTLNAFEVPLPPGAPDPFATGG